VLKSGLRPEFNLTPVLDFEMFTNTRVCVSVLILIVMEWIVVQVLGINFAGTNFAYLPVDYLVRYSISHFYVASAP